MTQRQAAETSVGEWLQRKEGYEQKQQLEWERARWVAYSIFGPFVKNRPVTPQSWVRFPWEKGKRAKMIEISPNDVITLDNIFTDFQSRKGGI